MSAAAVAGVLGIGAIVALAVGMCWCTALQQRRAAAAALGAATPGSPPPPPRSAASEFLLTLVQCFLVCLLFGRGGSGFRSGGRASAVAAPNLKFNFRIV